MDINYSSNVLKQTKIENVGGAGTTYYYGYADIGRATNEAYWAIKRVTIAANVTTEEWAVGDSRGPTGEEMFIWDERAVYTYSTSHDTSAPTLTTVTIASNNTDTTRAKVGDVVTLTIVASEALSGKPTVALAGHTLSASAVVKGADAAHYTATYTMVSGDTNGAVAISVSAFSDLAGNTGVTVTAVTGGGDVTFDKTVPTMSSAVKNSVTEIDLTLSEVCLHDTIAKANDGGFVVSETGAPGTTYAVSAIDHGVSNDHVTITVADMTASAAAGVTVTYVHAGNGTVADLASNAMATDATGVVIAPW